MGIVNGCYSVEIKTSNSSLNNSIDFNIKHNLGNSCQVGIVKYPTGNCQLSSIAYLAYLMEFVNNKKDDVIAIIKEIYKMSSLSPSQLILVDVKEPFITHVENCFTIMFKHPYVSTNGSLMCLFMVKL